MPFLRKLRGQAGRRAAALLIAGLLAGILVPVTAGAGPALARPARTDKSLATSTSGCTRPPGAVSCSPQTWTPRLPAKTPTIEQIRQIVQCGSLMYAVGDFSQIIGRDPRTGTLITYRRNGAFSFQATRPFAVTRWDPNVRGHVNSIAVGGRNCSVAYLGGSFGWLHGTVRNNLAEVSTSTGAVLTGFQGDANREVETLLLHDGRLLTGGFFTRINGSRARYFVGLDSATGAPDRYLGLNISGNYQYPGVASNATRVFNQQLSHDGTRLLVEGDFTSVGGRQRQQIFMLSLGRNRGRVTGWTSPDFYQHCWTNHPFYVRAAAWGPTDAAIYTADTGYQPPGTVGNQRAGLCDAATRFPSTETSVSPLWVNYTGCDSLFSVAAGYGTVYFAGHERWADNSDGCNAQGPSAVSAPGLTGLAENTNTLLVGADGNGLYSRARGLGADDMLLTWAGLWIASDNYGGSSTCGGVPDLAGLCFLPR